MITEKNHKLLTSQLFVTDCTKKGLASMHSEVKVYGLDYGGLKLSTLSHDSSPWLITMYVMNTY